VSLIRRGLTTHASDQSVIPTITLGDTPTARILAAAVLLVLVVIACHWLKQQFDRGF
jgi:hypothetical protein